MGRRRIPNHQPQDCVGTQLITLPIDDVSDAGFLIGTNQVDNRGFRRCPIVLVPSSSYKWWVSVPKGFTAIVMKHGRYVGQWKEGFHWCPPFVSISHLVTQQYVVYDTPVKECPTQDNVMVEIDVTVVFHVLQTEDDIQGFAYKLGPEKLDKMLKAFQEEAVRDMARKRRYNQIYDLMDTKGDEQLANTVRTMNDNFKDFGIEVVNITITNVHLPQDLARTMQDASTWDSKNRYNAIQQDYDLLKIDNEEFQRKRKQEVVEERKEAQSQFDKEIAVASASVKEVVAGTKKLIAEISEKEKADVLDISSQSDLKVAEIEAKKDLELAQIKSKGRAEVERIKSELGAEVATRRAEAEKVVAGNKAQALSFKAEAERIAITKLKQKRDFEQKMKHLAALKSTALNKSISVSGNNGDNAVAQLLAAQRNAAVLGLNVQ